MNARLGAVIGTWAFLMGTALVGILFELYGVAWTLFPVPVLAVAAAASAVFRVVRDDVPDGLQVPIDRPIVANVDGVHDDGLHHQPAQIVDRGTSRHEPVSAGRTSTI
jgi:hypothetical protein